MDGDFRTKADRARLAVAIRAAAAVRLPASGVIEVYVDPSGAAWSFAYEPARVLFGIEAYGAYASALRLRQRNTAKADRVVAGIEKR